MHGSINKFLGGFGIRKRIDLPDNLLKLSRISVLTLDERWNIFFKNLEKTPVIVRCEERILELIKERARLTEELKEGAAAKKRLLRQIMQFTADAMDNDDDDALGQIDDCKTSVQGINARNHEIELRLAELPSEIMNANMELLENAASYLYHDIKKRHRRMVEVNELIEDTRDALEALEKDLAEYEGEREAVTASYNEMYSSFHDLLGAELISELDKIYEIE